MSIFPSPYSVVHIVRIASTEPDENDDFPVVPQTPVVRKVMAIAQRGRFGSSHQIMDTESLQKVESVLTLTVANPEAYTAGDQVLLYPTLDDEGNYVSGSGTAFWVDGIPTDERTGPWPGLLGLFGGVVKLKRVT